MREGEIIETFKVFGQIAQLYTVNTGFKEDANDKEVMWPIRKGILYVKYSTEEAAERCYQALRKGVQVPRNSQEFLCMYAERCSKELVMPGFPHQHRNGLWEGEHGKYAKPVNGKWGSTVFGEFDQKSLNERKELYSGQTNFRWPITVTEAIWKSQLAIENDAHKE